MPACPSSQPEISPADVPAEAMISGPRIASDLEFYVNPGQTTATVHTLFVGIDEGVHLPFTFPLTLRTSGVRIIGDSWKYTS